MKVRDVVKACITNFYIVENEKIVYRPFQFGGCNDFLDKNVEWLDADEQGILVIGI